LAVKRAREGRAASLPMSGAAVLGLGFVVIKTIEWKQKFALGLTIETNDYFMYYFMAGGIHLLHVLVGTGFLFHGAVTLCAQDGSANPKTIEAIGIFWHLVDLLWVFLFALFYLV
jgi:nitric oxide reductase NorE protein